MLDPKNFCAQNQNIFGPKLFVYFVVGGGVFIVVVSTVFVDVAVVVVVGPRNLALKFGQNWVNNL